MKSKLALKLLSLLGFSSIATACDDDFNHFTPQPPMYGTPSANYVLNVEVRNVENNYPINGIRVSVIRRYDDASQPDTLYRKKTDEDGLAKLQFRNFPTNTHEIVAEDVDGSENGGTFSSASTEIVFTASDYEGEKDFWFQGTATKDVTIKLSKKE